MSEGIDDVQFENCDLDPAPNGLSIQVYLDQVVVKLFRFLYLKIYIRIA